MPDLLLVAVQLALLASALVGGVFIAFSDFIMRSLARTTGTGGVEAMQIINREVFRWVFMILFLGLTPLMLGLALYGAFLLGGSDGVPLVAAGLTYVIGCFGVTVLCNVPLNERLAKMSLQDSDTPDFWHQIYVPRWTRWNTIRGIACVVSAGILLWAMPVLLGA